MERLQKVLAHAGVASRRKAEALIKEGHVKVNGKIVTEMGILVSGNESIEVDGVPIDREEPVYFLLNKPRGVISAVSDPKERPVVTDFFGHVKQRIYPIGRLDYDTTGALILTNDGELANMLMHPKYHVDKKYIAKVKGIPEKSSLRKIERGIVIEGKKTSPSRAKLLEADKTRDTAIIELTIHEGRNHQVKNMFQAIGHPVQKLKRETYGNLTLEGLNAGEWRELTPHEVKQLRHLASEQNAK